MSHLLSAGGDAGRYVDWGVVHISVTNLVVIALMIVTFVLALLLPFPSGRKQKARHGGSR